MRGVAAQAVESCLFVPQALPRDWMADQGVPLQSDRIQPDLDGSAVILECRGTAAQQGDRVGCLVDLHAGLFDSMATQAQGHGLSARLSWETAGVGIMADQALLVLEGPMGDGFFLSLMTLAAQFATLDCEHDAGLLALLLRRRPVAALTARVHGGVDKLALLLVWVASEAGFGPDLLGGDIRVFGYSLRRG